jgi:hypothetical protein
VGSIGQVLTYTSGGQLEWTTTGGGAGTILAGVAGYFTYYPANGTTVDDQAVLYTDGTNVGIGAGASPLEILHVKGGSTKGIRIESTLENALLDFYQTGLVHADARNWRIVSNWQAHGTLDFQVSNANNTAPSVNVFTINKAGDLIANALAKIYLGNSYLVESANSILNIFCGVYNELTVDGINHGTVIRATSKLFLDGAGGVGGDTYLSEVSANGLRFTVGGVSAVDITSTFMQCDAGVNFVIQPTSLFYLDGGGDTYIYEGVANNVYFKAGGAFVTRWNPTSFFSYQDVILDATKKLYFDGGSDTYIFEASANYLTMIVGGNTLFSMTSTAAYFGNDVIVEPTKKLYLDGGTNTYITESSGDVMDFYSGGNLRARISTSGLALGNAINANVGPLYIRNTMSISDQPVITLYNSSYSYRLDIGWGTTSGAFIGCSDTSMTELSIVFNVGGTAFTFNGASGYSRASGNFGIASTSFGGGTGSCVAIANASTNPSSNPTGGGILYADGGAGKWRGSGGTVTTFGPAEPHCPTCGTDYMHEWENKEYGYLAVCMNCMTKEIGERPWILHEKN